MKKRILVTGEASFIRTGFAKFSKELLHRLSATDKYVIAEYGNWAASNDENARKLPWKFYGTLPLNDEEKRIYDSNRANSFGAYKFDAVVSDFQPDILINQLDPWMMQHLVTSQYRSFYKLILTPTVDSAPQQKVWIDEIFKKADIITTYSRWSKKVLENQGVKVKAVTSPGIDIELYRPKDKYALRKEWGFKEGLKIIGTVMRNQKRKCFPDLFEAYAKLRRKYSSVSEVNRSVLLCHTSYPDLGWDIPELLNRSGMQRHIIFTYKCDACTKIFFSWFLPCNPKDGRGQCIFCGQNTAHMPSTHNGVTEEELVDIYNLMDIYIQPAICEGWGLPIVESKACGIPGLYSNYSAMEDHVENGGGMPIDIDRFYLEAETMAIRSLPSQSDMVEKLHFLLTNNKKCVRMGKKARKVVEELHTLDITSKIYEEIIDSLEIHDRKLTWNSRPRIRNLPPPCNLQLSNEDFVRWCYATYQNREPDAEGFSNWMNNLARGASRGDIENFFRQQIIDRNMFEKIRWDNSLTLRGVQSSNLELLSDKIPGMII